MKPPSVIADARFLDAPSGRLFAVHHRPDRAEAIRGNVLIVPPFNEEMNRSRSMMTLQALELAGMGFGTLVVDVHGTGDSAGEFIDARWEVWVGDIQTALAWLEARPGGCQAVLGIRLGAMLAACSLAGRGAHRPALIFWQPVADGKSHMTQFLRVRMAAQLDRPNLPKETPTMMRAQFSAGESVEIAGYNVHPELAEAIDRLRLDDFRPASATRILWLENSNAEVPELSPASQKLAQAWVAQGVGVECQTFAGPAFWHAYDRETAPAAIARTSAWFKKTFAAP